MATKQAAEKSAKKENVPAADNLEQLQDMDVEVSIELGRRKMTLDQALELGDNSVIGLDKVVGEPVEVRLNGKLFARAEVVTVSENFGVRLLEIVKESQEG